MSGLLTQAIVNLTAAEQQIAAVGGLPSAAQQIQAESPSIIDPAIQQIGQMQRQIGAFVQSSTAALNDIRTGVSQNEPQATIQPEIAQVQAQAGALQTSVNQVYAQLADASTRVLAVFNQLATIESDLTSQITGLQGQLGNAQNEAAAARSKYYYLLALGPFGLIGLAAALALYEELQSQVSGYENQIAQLNGQINALNVMKSGCQALATGFQAVVTRASSVKNTVSFVADDILTIGSDLQSGAASSVLNVVVTAALTEIGTLASDAS
jgi:DNA repair exonuclease SbcCD ATPase subunit